MTSGKVIVTMQSAQRYLAESSSALNSEILKSALLDIQVNVDNDVEHLIEMKSLESVQALVNISGKLQVDSDTLALNADLSTLQTFQRRIALLVESRFWGVLEPILEPVDNLAILPDNLAVLRLVQESMREETLRSQPGVAKLRERLFGALEEEAAVLASASAIRRRFQHLVTAQDISSSVTLNAFKRGAKEAKVIIIELEDSWSKVNVDELVIIQKMLLEREESLGLLKISLSPTGVFAHKLIYYAFKDFNS